MQIGDLVLTTPVFRAIKSAFPNHFLAAAVNKDFADLIRFNPFLDNIFQIDKHSLKSFISSIQAIRQAHFNLTINLNQSERASSLAILSGADNIVGYAKPPFSLFFDKVVPNLKRTTHQIISHFNVLDYAGFHLPLAKSDVFIGDTNVNHFLRLFPNDPQIVAFNVGASWQSKRWLPEYFAFLADNLIIRGFNVAFLGSYADFPIVNDCLAFMKYKPVVLTGKFNLLQLAAFFDCCRLLISNDSGPMHIAAARNLPAISIFGSSPVIGFKPWLHSHSLFQSHAPCHPCYKHVCPLKGDGFMRCMKEIAPEYVLKKALEMLSAFDKPAKDLPIIPGAFDCKVIAKQN